MKSRFFKAVCAFILSLAILFSSPIIAFASSHKSINTQADVDSAIIAGFGYLRQEMNADGGICWFDETSSAAATIRVVQALASAGYSQNYLQSDNGKRPIDYLLEHGEDWVNQVERDSPGFNVARAGQLLTAIAAANENPHNFGNGSSDLIFELRSRYDAATFVFGSSTEDNITDQVWAILGLTASNASVPVEAVDWLASVQAEDGSWNDGFGSYLDITPLGILALISSGFYTSDSTSIQSARVFMMDNQQSDGGWQTDWDTEANPNITGVMLQAMSILGQTPDDDLWQQAEGDPILALLSVQQENGAFGGEFANAYTTADAIIGLSNKNITSLGYLKTAANAFDFLFTRQEPSGGWENTGQTIDVILAIRAAGWQPNSVSQDAGTPLEFLRSNLNDYIASGPDAMAKAIIGIVAGGKDPANFLDFDLPQQLLDTYDDTTHAFGSPENTWHQALSILGCYAAEMVIPTGAVDTLLSLQQENGGWEYMPGFGTTPDDTSIAIQALVASGYAHDDDVMTRAVDYLLSTQTPDGGWGNSSSTAYALMALNLIDESHAQKIREAQQSTRANLVLYQNSNGSFMYSPEYPDASIMATASAMLALFGQDYIIKKSENELHDYAALVIDPGSGYAQTACVVVTDSSMNGYELLEASGLEYVVEEGFTKSILGVANQDGETNYWSYWYWDGRDWVFQSSGAANSVVLPGTIEAWHFTSWEEYPSQPPDIIPDFQNICMAPQLVNYQQQPYLDFNNISLLRKGSEVGTNVDLIVQNAPSPTKDAPNDPLSETRIEAEQTNRSPVPFYIIGAVAIVLFFVLVPVFKRRK